MTKASFAPDNFNEELEFRGFDIYLLKRLLSEVFISISPKVGSDWPILSGSFLSDPKLFDIYFMDAFIM